MMWAFEWGVFLGGTYLIFVLLRKLWKRSDVTEKIEAVKETEMQYEAVTKFVEDHDLNVIKEKRETIDTFKRE